MENENKNKTKNTTIEELKRISQNSVELEITKKKKSTVKAVHEISRGQKPKLTTNLS